MSDLALYADLSARKLVTRDGGAVTLPVLVLGDQCVCTLRLMEHGEAEALVEKSLNVRTLRASIGKVLEPPTSGGFTLRFDGAPSAGLNPGSSAVEMKAALDALDPGGTYQLQEVLAAFPGCWLLRFAATGAVPLAVASNTLKPESFVRIRAFDQGGQRWHEVRLVQTPVVFTGTHERVLPPPPNVQRIRSGHTEAGFKQNEVQALVVPADFRGTYYLRWDFRTTRLLGIDDGPQEIAAALNAMFTGGDSRFDVTNPEPDHAYIEFIGELGGDPQPLIEVSVHSFAPGVLTFTLDLARAELASALRDTALVELPFEIELEVVDDGEDAADPAVPGRLITLCQQPLKLAREQIWEELADIPAIDWLRPPQPRNYIPFTRDQIITGSQHYVAVIGDGVQRGFSLNHNLGTSAFHLTIRENEAGGRRLRDDEFALHFPDNNEAALDFPVDAPPPPPDGLVVTISTAGPRSAFERHTHYASEIIGLDDRFYALGARVAAIEELLPTAPPTADAAAAAGSLSIPLASFAQLVPGKWRPGFNARAAFTNGTGLPSRGGGLLPAIHSTSATNAILPLPDPAAHTGVLFNNNTASPITIPGGLGRKSATVSPGGFYGSDGRVWYALTRDVTPENTTSYFPRDFERELFRIAVSEKMLRAGQTLKAEFDLTLAMLRADTSAQWLLVIECGAATQDTAPATTGENLADLIWQAEPLLSQRIILTAAAYPSRFGVSIARNAAGTAITASKLLYGQYEACGTAPDSPAFTLRARLIQFDTQDSVTGARGWAYFSFDNAQAGIL